MEKQYVIRQLFNEETLKHIKMLIDNSDNCWVDGLSTFSGPNKKIKKNLQLRIDSEAYREISRITMSEVDKDLKFHYFTLGSSSTSITVSKYEKGFYYDIHLDIPESGKYSTTIFLDDPSTYTGGELCLYINEKEEKFKLPAGYAITYNTGLLHRVNKVTDGERKAIVFWTKSNAKDAFLISVCDELNKIKENVSILLKDEIKTDFSSFDSYNQNPILQLINLIASIKRKLIQ
jgi:PKHD-type hydroxylase